MIIYCLQAVGCLFYEMCALKPPFDAQNLISLFFKIIKGEYEVWLKHFITLLLGSKDKSVLLKKLCFIQAKMSILHNLYIFGIHF